jgi:hypothetical protein
MGLRSQLLTSILNAETWYLPYWIQQVLFIKVNLPPKKIKKISAEEIIASYEADEDLMERLEGVHERFFDRIAKVQLSGQPHVIK